MAAMDALPLPRFVFYIIAYVFVLIAALVVVSVVLHRLTREERQAARRQAGGIKATRNDRPGGET
jgi:hypothetical protein